MDPPQKREKRAPRVNQLTNSKLSRLLYARIDDPQEIERHGFGQPGTPGDPEHGAQKSRGSETEAHEGKVKAALLWVTYRKDLEWFRVSARSFGRHARGFIAAKVVVPNPDVEAFREAAEPYGIAVCGFDEHPSKGMLHHEMMVCCGDLHFPEADVIFHIDSDCVFAFPFTPDEYLPDGKVLIPFTDFQRMLTTPLFHDEMRNFMGFTGRAIDFNRGGYFWKFAADFALGFPVDRATMVGWPMAHLRETYAKTREIISARHGNFEDYIFSCRNEFPQTFCEFETLGAVAHRFFQDRYSWRDIETQGYPPVRVISSWSHGGMDRPHDYPGEVGGNQTPRQLFQRLGFL